MRKRRQHVSRHVCPNRSEYNVGRDLLRCRKKPAGPLSPTRTQEFVHSTGNSRRIRSKTYKDEEDFEDTWHSRTPKFPRIEDIADLVQEQLNQGSQQFSKGIKYSRLRPTDSPLSREITSLRFPKKFIMPSFDHYSGTSDLLHLHQ